MKLIIDYLLLKKRKTKKVLSHEIDN